MISKSFKSYLLAGFVVWVPILITFIVLRFIVDLLDQSIALLPHAYQPEILLGFHMPGLGVLLSLAILLSTGIIATNILGQKIVNSGEALLTRIPFIRSIYNASKQVIQAIFATNSEAFRKVLLVQYPRQGMWSLAFQTGANGIVADPDNPQPMISVFIPTTPNPTSGFILMVPQAEVRELDMSIDEALKYIISLGVMPPAADANKPVPSI